MGGATDKEEIREKFGTDRWTKKRGNHSMGGPTVKRSTDDAIPGFKISRRNPFLVDDLRFKPGQKLLIQNSDDLVGVSGGFLCPIDAGGVGGCVDQKEVVVVVGRGGSRIGSCIHAEIDGGILRGAMLTKHLLELERVVVGKEDIVVG